MKSSKRNILPIKVNVQLQFLSCQRRFQTDNARLRDLGVNSPNGPPFAIQFRLGLFVVCPAERSYTVEALPVKVVIP